MSLTVDGIPIFSRELDDPLAAEQVGAVAWGSGRQFRGLDVDAMKPRAFVVMQFGEGFDDLYDELIRPVGAAAGLEVVRADEIHQPGMIIQDIVRGLMEASIVIAEISPENPNVFYELGYAHALDKPTILLARRDTTLPFDVSPYRTIFYDDTIAGKRQVERLLGRHLDAILGRPTG